MSYHYSNPARESEPTALPNVDIWRDDGRECADCGSTVPVSSMEPGIDACPDCGSTARPSATFPGYWHAFGFPGCLHDSEPVGPFDTEAEALADARAGLEDDGPELCYFCQGDSFWDAGTVAGVQRYECTECGYVR